MATANDEFWDAMFEAVADRPRVWRCDEPQLPDQPTDDLPDRLRRVYLGMIHAWAVRKWPVVPALHGTLTLENFEEELVDLMGRGVLKIFIDPGRDVMFVGMWAGDGYVQI